MASLHKDSRTGNWLVMFRWTGKQYRKSCETASQTEAKEIEARVESTIRLLKHGRIEIPEGADPGVWILSDGKLKVKPAAVRRDSITLEEVCGAYSPDQLDKAETTLNGESKHINHLKRILGDDAEFASLTLETMQGYVSKRGKEGNRYGGKVSGTTIKKELTTFMQIWDWARQRGHVDRLCPIKDPHRPRKWAVKLPKPEETERFMTWQEIERRIARGGLSDKQQKELWKYVFLDETQVKKLLEHVQKHATHTFIHPMFALTAYTGLRRSEMCRSMIDDFNFDDGLVIIRERKRRKDRAATTRDVPMHLELKKVMQAWFKDHPGGQFAIAPPLKMPHRKVKSQFETLSPEEAHHHFKKTLAGSKWEVIRGFHVLRHSFGAICTRAGIPMNVIAKWMGHTTDEMMRLYQHLFPQDEQKWMEKLPF